MLKIWIFVVFLVLLLSVVQINWAVHEGLSGSDMGLSRWLHMEMLCLYPALMAGMLLLVFKKNKTKYLSQTVILSAMVCIYWLLFNYLNFSIYIASWSTFSASEIWVHVGFRSLLSIGSCGLLLFTGLYFILKKM